MVNELLESPFLGQFADDNNHQLISQSEISSQQSEYADSEQKMRQAKKQNHAEKRDQKKRQQTMQSHLHAIGGE